MAPFIAMETAAVVAAGDNTPRGEESGVIVPVVTKGSGKGVGIFDTAGLPEESCVAVGETFVGVGMGVSKPPEILTDVLKNSTNYCTFSLKYLCQPTANQVDFSVRGSDSCIRASVHKH